MGSDIEPGHPLKGPGTGLIPGRRAGRFGGCGVDLRLPLVEGVNAVADQPVRLRGPFPRVRKGDRAEPRAEPRPMSRRRPAIL
ncbi:hypothetical protein GCM10011320_45860 [Neoroseomonas lacus]|uniref:Uncharacterized protein n=1 Tax=Neoroseomonas lacus TaxID=287609 RepID=A0A917KZ29_9PROT|nr:hypothetical protein GCM10011320_45860 [Neoroseomonas lacus]